MTLPDVGDFFCRDLCSRRASRKSIPLSNGNQEAHSLCPQVPVPHSREHHEYLSRPPISLDHLFGGIFQCLIDFSVASMGAPYVKRADALTVSPSREGKKLNGTKPAATTPMVMNKDDIASERDKYRAFTAHLRTRSNGPSMNARRREATNVRGISTVPLDQTRCFVLR